MKKVVVVSDSHGNKKLIDRIFNEVEFDNFLFLGDCISDLGVYINDPRVKVVRGNCDFFSNEKHDGIVVVEGVTVFMTHGDKYGVKSTLRHLYNQVAELNLQLVVYGHTHIYREDKLGGIVFLNPGALSQVRGGNETFALINIEDKKISISKSSF